MKLYGSITELVKAVLRKSGFAVTVEPSTASADTTFQLPVAGGGTKAIVTADASQTLTNKSIDADSNTVTNIDNADIKAAAAIARTKLASGTASHVLINDGTGVLSSEAQLDKTRGGTGISSTATFPSTGTIVTQTSSDTGVSRLQNKEIDTTTKITPDTINQRYIAFTQSTQAASTTATLSTDLITASRTLSLPDATTTLVGHNNSQTLSNKTLGSTNTLTGATAASFTNTGTITLPTTTTTLVGNNTVDVFTNKTLQQNLVDNYLDFNEEAAPSTPAGSVVRVYAKADGKIYKKDDTGTEAEIGSGSGSGRNYLSDWNDGSKTVGTISTVAAGGNLVSLTNWYSTSTGTAFVVESSSSTALRQSTNYLTSANTAANLDGSVFFQLPAQTPDGVDAGKPVSVSFDVTGPTANTEWDVVVAQYNSTGTFIGLLPVAGTASASTSTSSAVIGSGTYSFKGFFIPSSTATDIYALRFRRLTGSNQLRIDSLFIGPQTILQGPAVTDWVDYTVSMTASGGGSVSVGTGGNATAASKWRRVGNSMQIIMQFAWGTTSTSFGTSGSYRIDLPTGYSVEATQLPVSTGADDIQIGTGILYDSGSDRFTIAVNWSGTFIRMALSETLQAVGPLSPVTIANGDVIFAQFTVPIVGWTSNVTMAERSVEEYASNSSTSDADDTTSFAYGSLGSLIPTITAADVSGTRSKRVRFSSPILPTDTLTLEVNAEGGATNWVVVGQVSGYQSFTIQSDGTVNQYGMYINSNVGISTDISVRFGRAGRIALGTGYATAGSSYPETAGDRWRVRKVSGGAAVGYPISASNITAPTFRATRSGNQSINNGADTKIQFDTETLDTHRCFDSTTNYRFTPTVGGIYQVTVSAQLDNLAADKAVQLQIWKNGALYSSRFSYTPTTGVTLTHTINDLVSLNGSTDYIEAYIFQGDTLSRNLQTGSFFTATLACSS